MQVRRTLLQTTMLVGVVGVAYLSARDAGAAELAVAAPKPAAVDGVNGKVEGLGGSLAKHSLYGGRGALSIPLGTSFGAQIDGAGGRWNGDGFGSIAGHLFWRDPSQALFGIYANYTRWNGLGGLHVTQIAGEGAYYWHRWTIEGIAGVEYGNSTSSSSTVDFITGGSFPPSVTTTTAYDVESRFFDQVNLKYYFTDNLNAYVGHRYLGGRNMLALGGEAALPIRGGIMASAFVEGRIGENDSSGIWGGLKFYFGQKDKSLIARHRQDDPPIWAVDSLFSIAAAVNNPAITTTSFCPAGSVLQLNGLC